MKRLIITENFYKKYLWETGVFCLVYCVSLVYYVFQNCFPLILGEGFIRCEDNTASRGSFIFLYNPFQN